MCLIMHSKPNEDKSISYAQKIQDELKKKRIKTEIHYANRFELFDIVNTVKAILMRDRKSEYFLNVASGSKIHAIGCMIACMIFDNRDNLRPFYAIPEEYPRFKSGEQQTYGVSDIRQLSTYRINTPNSNLLEALTELKSMISTSRGGFVYKGEYAERLEQKGIITVGGETDPSSRIPKNHSKSKYTTLDRVILGPLKNTWCFVETEKLGRKHKIFFTDDGIAASKFLF